MRLFLIGIGHLRPEQIDVARKLKEKHDIRYWVRMDHVFEMDEAQFPGTVFHTYKSALAGRPAQGIDTSHFDPPSTELIDLMSSYESEFLTMMNKWYPDWILDKRKDFYHDLLAYWSGILDTYQPEGIIFLEIPHEMYSFIIFALAKHKGIRTIMFENTLHYDRLLLYEDYRVGNTAMIRGQEAGFKKLDDISELSADVREEYEQTSKKDEPPRFTSAFFDGYRGWIYWNEQWKAVRRFIKDGTVWKRATYRFLDLFAESLKGEYTKHSSPADLSVPYVYLALHSQPERTTSPQAGVYVNQLLIVETIAAALPDGWYLYVKEHPAQWALSRGKYTSYRYRGYYAEIAKIRNVRLVPIETNTFSLMRSARTVATVTGTVGWEARLRDIPVLVFGYAWYRYCTGVFRITSAEQCRAVLGQIKDGYTVHQQDVLDFLGALDAASFWCSLNPYVSSLGKEQADRSIENMYQAITAALGTQDTP